jgi:hypothetical protein
MDVHKESIVVAYITNEHHAEVVYVGAIGTRQYNINQIIRKLQAESKHSIFVDNTSPCGSWLYLYFTKKSYVYWIVVPSLIPKKGMTTSKLIGKMPSNLPG